MILYWVETEDHHEDWFMLAESEEEAAKLHEDFEGYNRGDAFAREVREVPGDIESVEVGWPSNDLLKACGGKFISEETPRVVEINGDKYSEGLLEHTVRMVNDNVFEATGRGRPNQTECLAKEKN